MKDPYQARGRDAHEGRSAREDAYFDSRLEDVLALPNGKEMARTDYYNRGGAAKFGHGDTIDKSFVRRVCCLPGCGLELIYDDKGYAFCPKCGTIYNDGKPPETPKLADQILIASEVHRKNFARDLRKSCKC